MVTCPLIRDNTVNTNGPVAVVVRVFRNFGLYSTPLACILHSVRPGSGQAVEFDTKQTLEQGNSFLSLDVNSSVNQGQYVVTCSLPPKGRVRSILLVELF
ncbi:MAG: hypothetical protein V3U75_00920 [Methylococcaceae bacterium]